MTSMSDTELHNTLAQLRVDPPDNGFAERLRRNLIQACPGGGGSEKSGRIVYGPWRRPRAVFLLVAAAVLVGGAAAAHNYGVFSQLLGSNDGGSELRSPAAPARAAERPHTPRSSDAKSSPVVQETVGQESIERPQGASSRLRHTRPQRSARQQSPAQASTALERPSSHGAATDRSAMAEPQRTPVQRLQVDLEAVAPRPAQPTALPVEQLRTRQRASRAAERRQQASSAAGDAPLRQRRGAASGSPHSRTSSETAGQRRQRRRQAGH